MNYDILVHGDILFWIEAIIAFFFGALMLIDSIKYKDPLFKLLFFVFLVVLLKSLVNIGMQLTNVYYYTTKELFSQETQQAVYRLFDMAGPMYYLKYTVWNVLETVFIIVLCYVFIFSRKNAESKDVGLDKILMWAQIIAAVVLLGVNLVLSLQTQVTVQIPDGWSVVTKGPNGSFIPAQSIVIYKSSIEAVNFFNQVISYWLFFGWKLALLIMAWATVSRVYGYTANILKPVARYKMVIFVFLGIEVVFNIFSVFSQYYYNYFWFLVQILSMILLAIFAYGVHSAYITSVQEQVDNLARERDIIISLMRDISAIIGSGDFDLDTVIKQIVDSVVKGTSARGGAVLLKDSVTGRLLVKYVKGLHPPTKPFKTVQGLALTESMIVEKFKAERIAIGEGLIGQVAETGETVYIPDALKSKRYIQTVQEHMMVTSFVAVPLKTKDEVFGVLTSVDDARVFLASDVSLIETLGEQAAITIKQIQMYQQILEKKQAEKEVGVAAEIQTSLVPHIFPETDKYEIYAFSIAAKGVGGDYYDYIDFGNNKVAVTMFDVSGKGVPAALIMVMIRSILRTIASLDEDTRDVITKLNNTAAQDIVEDRYATGFYLLFDAEKGIMSYTNAGHGPLVLYRTNQDVFEFLDTEGMPVGIMAGVEYGQNYTTLEKGDIAILYTDGITEAMNLSHEEYGMDRFKDVVRKYRKESAREIANKILEDVNRFVANAPQHDDETLLILKTR